MNRALPCIIFLFFSFNLLSAQQLAMADVPELTRLVSMPGHNSNDLLKVFPNPVFDYIQVSENEVVNQIVVYNLIGKKLKFFTYEPGERYYVGDLRKGMYLVQLLDNRKKILTTKRISKE